MKEYKFRAWHTGNIRGVCAPKPEMGKPEMCYPHPNWQANALQWKSEGQPVIVMQFTGVIDKNGADIYEGDVISDHLGVGVIEYKDEYGAFRVNYKNSYAKWFIDYLSGERKTIKVIGNIYENPELMA